MINNLKLSHNIRSKIIKLSYETKSAHLGSSLSCVEILISIFLEFNNKKDETLLQNGKKPLTNKVPVITTDDQRTNEILSDDDKPITTEQRKKKITRIRKSFTRIEQSNLMENAKEAILINNSKQKMMPFNEESH